MCKKTVLLLSYIQYMNKIILIFPVDYLLSVTRTLTARKPRAVTAAIPSPAFHHAAESPISRPSCCKCLEHMHKAMYYKYNSSHNTSATILKIATQSKIMQSGQYFPVNID
jgi:hypothetical protein